MRAIREVYCGLHCAKAQYSLPFSSYREIPLTQGHVALVDPEDYEQFASLRWCALVDPRTKRVYAARDSKRTLLHRLIMAAPAGMLVDHVDGNTLNNRRSNLRLATHAQNMRNRHRAPRNKQGYRGVHACNGHFYRGAVVLNGRTHYTPQTTSAEQAARDRDELVMRLHGEFAVLNFSERGNQ